MKENDMSKPKIEPTKLMWAFLVFVIIAALMGWTIVLALLVAFFVFVPPKYDPAIRLKEYTQAKTEAHRS